MTTHLSPAMEAAWAAYHRELEDLRRQVYGSALAAPGARVEIEVIAAKK